MLKTIQVLTVTLFFLCLSIHTNAQLTDGSTVENFTLTDINGDTHSLYEYLDEGKYVIIDISATWCISCWNFHESFILNEVNAAYGPNGSDEMAILFIEGDANTPEDNLYGNGNTQGNWVEETSYPIFDGDEAANVAVNKLNISGFPTIYMICPNRKIFNIGRLYSVQEYYDQITTLSDCQATTSNHNIIESNISIQPNPASEFIHINLEGQTLENIELSIYDMTGKLIKAEYFSHISEQLDLEIDSYEKGIYMLTLTNKDVDFSTKIIVNK